MEHGLGYTFLVRFLEKLSIPDSTLKTNIISEKLISRLKTNEDEDNNIWIDLEYNVGTAYIDIVFGIEDWIFSIENKIYATSVTKDQLKTQYKEFNNQKLNNKKLCMIYLIPIENNSDFLNTEIENEFENR